LRDLRGARVTPAHTVVTSSANASPALDNEVRAFAAAWGVPYETRCRRPLRQMFADDPSISYLGVYERAGLIRLYQRVNSEPFFYHPGMALLRVKQLVRGDRDRMIDVAAVQAGDEVLDCTAGLCADAVVLAHAVGAMGHCLAMEASPWVAFVVAVALRDYQSGHAAFDAALRRVDLRVGDYRDAFAQAADQSVDLVYLDPMFAGKDLASPGIRPLRSLAYEHGVSAQDLMQGRRLARRAVVVKDVRPGPLLQALDIEPVSRTSQSTWYGYVPSG